MHAERGSLAVFDAAELRRAVDQPRRGAAVEWGAALPALVLLAEDEANAGLSFRNLARVDVMPVRRRGVADVIGAASLLVSEAALPQLVARASGVGARHRGREEA